MTKKPLFSLGEVLVTQRVLEEKSAVYILNAVNQHQCGDWGNPHLADFDANEFALVDQKEIVSNYGDDPWGDIMMITTDSTRSKTIVSFAYEK